VDSEAAGSRKVPIEHTAGTKARLKSCSLLHVDIASSKT
jgi:hypothetical protein